MIFIQCVCHIPYKMLFSFQKRKIFQDYRSSSCKFMLSGVVQRIFFTNIETICYTIFNVIE